MPLRIGLTGGIASGKSTVCDLFATAGAEIIDADRIVRAVCAPGEPVYKQIVAQFGTDMLLGNGDLNRPALREIIFNDASARQQLEAIIHPEVRQQLTVQLQQSQAAVAIVAVPLLIEAEMQDLFDRILLVMANPQTQLTRLLARETISEALAKQMIAVQIDDRQRLPYADDMIDNNGDSQSLAEQVQKLMANYQQLATNSL